MYKKITSIKERILHVADYYGIHKETFFKELGFSYANFRGAQKKKPISSESIEKVLSKYPEINPTWLITGEGKMLKKDESDMPQNSEVVSILKEQVREQTIYIKSLIRQLDAMNEQVDRLIKEKEK